MPSFRTRKGTRCSYAEVVAEKSEGLGVPHRLVIGEEARGKQGVLERRLSPGAILP